MDNENILTLDRSEPAAEQAPAQTAPEQTKLYPLDWGTTKVPLAGGKYKHQLKRPTREQIFAREDELNTEIPIGKKGEFQMPDPTATEDVDAKYYDLVQVGAEGYAGVIPAAHKAAAFQGLYQREIYIPEDADPFAEEVPVVEEIGPGDEPDYTIVHVLRQAAESELKRYRRRAALGEIKPGRRGKQNFVRKSTLKNAEEHYDLWCTRIDGVTIETPNPDIADLKRAVDPLIKRRVVETYVEAIVGGLLD